MFGSLDMKLGHLLLDNPWVGAKAAFRQSHSSYVSQHSGIELRQLVTRHHLELGDRIPQHFQSVHKAEAVGVYPPLESCFVHQETNDVVRNQQRIQFLDDPHGLEAPQRARGQSLVGIDLVNDRFDFPAFVVSASQVQGRAGFMVQQGGARAGALRPLRAGSHLRL